MKRFNAKEEYCPLCGNQLKVTQWKDTDGLHICEINIVCKYCGRFKYVWAYGKTYIEVDGEEVNELPE